jgi:hypothetical protein
MSSNQTPAKKGGKGKRARNKPKKKKNNQPAPDLSSSMAQMKISNRQALAPARKALGVDTILSAMVLPSKLRVSQIVEYITMPADCDSVVRYAAETGSVKTATVHPYDRINTRFALAAASGSTGSLLIEQNGFFAAKFRDPFRSSIHYLPYQTMAAWRYTGSFNRTYGANGQVADTWIPPLALPVASNNYPLAPHGPVYYPGTDDGKRGFYWIQQGDQAIIQWTSIVSVSSVVLKYWRWDFQQGQAVGVGETAPISGSGSSTFGFAGGVLAGLPGGYVAFEMLITPGVGTSILQTTLSLDHLNTGAPDIFAQRSTYDLAAVLPTVGDMRQTAASMMITNTTPSIYRGGQVAVKQVPKTKPWLDFVVNASPYTNVSSLSDAWAESSKEGAYAFLKPMDVGDMESFNQSYDNIAGTTQYGGYWWIKTDTEYLVMGGRMDTASSAVPSAYYTFCDGIEFMCNDQWRNCCLPEATNADWRCALDIVTKSPQYHQNFIHIMELVNFLKGAIKSVASGIATYGPMVTEFARNVSQVL